MRRDADRLASRTFDVLVVGGGVYGLTIAYDAAQRGLSVALVERDDFGSGASFNHARIIHGGLRYLQTLDVGRSRESVRERRTLAAIAPRALRPLSFVLPLTRSLTRGAIAMRAAFALDAFVGFDRHQGVPERLRLPAGRVLSRGEALARLPAWSARPETGAALWHDYMAVEADRLTLAYALAADATGAALANHVEVTALLAEGSRVTGARAVDGATGRALEIGARIVVNAAGADVARVAGALGSAVRRPLLKAMNLVVRRQGRDEAVVGRAPSGRNLFAVPWQDHTLFGTWESDRPAAPETPEPTGTEVGAFIAELNRTFPSLELTIGDVSLVHRGIVPAAVRAGGRVALEGREHIHDHAAHGVEGLVTVAGTKYTTARRVAERVTDLVFRKLGRADVPCRTARTPLPGVGDDETAAVVAPRLLAAYGSRAADVAELARRRPDLDETIAPSSPVTGAELVWAVREEMALTLADAVLRRTPLGARGFPGEAALARAADIVGQQLGWADERKRREMEAVRRFYAPLLV
jgi:glycerol-3-phosphate dehydrogenase